MDAPVFRHSNRVTFADTDASGWMHFTKFFRFVEEAEHAFLREVGVPVFDRSQVGWPRVNVACDFLKPLAFGEEVDTRLAILRLGNSSITWGFEIRKTASGEIYARGSMTSVLVDGDGKTRVIPTEYRDVLG
ncbi:MAG: thioesterase family protein [Verrucomicrobiota bacterium]